MDTEWASTFLAVVAAGSFVRAAERLHVTQSTVSARIRALEEQLGCTLFVRNRAGANLTAAGRQFQKHAATLVRTLEQARQDAGVAHGYRALLTVGARFALWVELLLRWLPLLREVAPDVSVRGEIGGEEALMTRLVERSMDIGVMYTPESRPGLTVEFLLEEQLVMVSTDAATTDKPSAGYVYVDWGPEFHAKHSMNFPDFGTPALIVGIAWLGLQHMLSYGGSGYFPQRLVRRYLEAGRLFRVRQAPTFALPAYMVYPTEGDPDLFGPALNAMRRVAAAPVG
ncbi:MAG: LysR family transcriptional regulator [Gammaproteobacteria bacterium]|nr:LysR family transcriptional regulator [Gammaproteobacteria bacterium]NIR85907.1 LysR family transcriptional regulator [Gammaproteobacteria bacterium]NIR91899.1 LysR family transcriptional regulator [Gammaproteobacteria bacterium]NIU07156.1 LysR family transcriptional regulator [Gammaproteobacteria bacterium]NIV53969.1 LysR family transcriptional regulator [Gammaproteobacteria bacterium]